MTNLPTPTQPGTELEVAVPAATPVAPPTRTPVHEAVRDQLYSEITPERVDALQQMLDAPTFNEVLHWLSSAKRGSLATKRGYAEDLAKIAAWAAEHFGVHPVPLLSIMDADAVTIWTVYTRSQGMATRTHRRALSTLSSLFTYAGRHGWPVSNPVSFEDHARPVGTSDNGRPVGATRVLDVEDIAELRDACETAAERLVFDLLYLLGLRVTEVVTAQVEHIDRDRHPNVLRFQRKRGQWAERQFSQDTQRHLDEHLAGRTDGPLLVTDEGEGLNRLQVVDITRRLARRAKIPSPAKVTPHVLRATAITALLDAGKPLHEVQKWAGHVRPETTEAYWQRQNSVKRDAVLTNDLSAMLDRVNAGMPASGGPV